MQHTRSNAVPASNESFAIALPSNGNQSISIAAVDFNNPQSAQSYIAANSLPAAMMPSASTNAANEVLTGFAYTNEVSDFEKATNTRTVPAKLITDIDSGTNMNGIAIRNDAMTALSAPISSTRMLNGAVSKFGTSSNFKMHEGSVLFAPKQNMLIETRIGTVKVDAGSVVLVMEHAHGLTVFNFDDAHRGAVEISLSGKRIGIAPGRHCTVAYRDNFSELNPAQTIPHRNMIVSKSADGKITFESEFSLPAAFDRVEPISTLMSSKHPHAKKLVSHMLKTAAVITQLNRSGVSFKQYTKPSITAFAGN